MLHQDLPTVHRLQDGSKTGVPPARQVQRCLGREDVLEIRVTQVPVLVEVRARRPPIDGTKQKAQDRRRPAKAVGRFRIMPRRRLGVPCDGKIRYLVRDDNNTLHPDKKLARSDFCTQVCGTQAGDMHSPPRRAGVGGRVASRARGARRQMWKRNCAILPGRSSLSAPSFPHIGWT